MLGTVNVFISSTPTVIFFFKNALHVSRLARQTSVTWDSEQY